MKTIWGGREYISILTDCCLMTSSHLPPFKVFNYYYYRFPTFIVCSLLLLLFQTVYKHFGVNKRWVCANLYRKIFLFFFRGGEKFFLGGGEGEGKGEEKGGLIFISNYFLIMINNDDSMSLQMITTRKMIIRNFLNYFRPISKYS